MTLHVFYVYRFLFEGRCPTFLRSGRLCLSLQDNGKLLFFFGATSRNIYNLSYRTTTY